MKRKKIIRCGWAEGNPLMAEYHDEEWGRPVHDDRLLFEFLMLEGAQAGLSWLTVLKKRGNYRKAFHNFEPEKISRYTKKKMDSLMLDAGIIRNSLKIEAARINARLFLDAQKEMGSFDEYIWQFVGGKPIRNKFKSWEGIPAKTAEAESMSKDLKKRGFKFVGPTICYAFMQAVGMVNDHTILCFRYKEL